MSARRADDADSGSIPAVELRRVRVILAEQPVLRGVDLAVRGGSKVALVGPNGAGKSTLLRAVAGLLRPTSGEIMIDGRAVAEDPWHARRAVGMVAHQSMLHPDLTSRENLMTYGRLYGLDRLDERVTLGLERVGLAARAGSRVSTLSRGMVQRLSLARALIHEPPVLLLDEAETGLDVRARDLLVDALDAEHTAILATHDLSYVAEVADEIVFLNRGRVVGQCGLAGLSPAEVRERYAEALAQRPAAEKRTPAAATPTSTAQPTASTSEAPQPVGVAD